VPQAHVEALLLLIATTLEAGATLQALGRGEALRSLPKAIAERVWMDADLGVPLSQTLAALELLDPGALALIRAKETQGALPAALRQVAQRLAQRRARRQQLLLALAYPVGLLLIASTLSPLPLLFTRGVGPFLVQAAPIWLLVLALAAFFLLLYPRLAQSHPVRRWLWRLTTAIPVGRTAALQSAMATFADVLGAALGAGIPVREAIRQACEAPTHPCFAGGACRILLELDTGATLRQALQSGTPLPPADLDSLSVAEQTGTLDTALARIAQDHDQRARHALFVGLGILTALAIVAVAGLLAWQIVAGWSTLWRDQSQLIDSLSR
jgi:type II secretory pathway component PulF